MTHTARKRDRTILLIAMAIFAGLSTWMAWASRGFLEADGITHYLSRRFAIGQPMYFVGIWSRPLCVALYCVSAKFGGLLATRAESLLLVLLTVPLTIAIARRLGLKRPAWAGLFLLTQPLLFAHSFSELTEVPFALLLAAAFYCYQRKWFGLMALLIAVSPLGRPEGFGLLLVAAVALVLHKRFAWLLVLPLGIAAWSLAGWMIYQRPTAYPWWRWLPANWPYSPDSVYGSGSVFKLLGVLPAVVGPTAFGCVAFGVAAMLRWGRRPVGGVSRFLVSHRARCRLLAILVPFGVLGVHSVLWATGKMASNGEPRYLLVAAPFWAVLAGGGLERLVALCHWRWPLTLVTANAFAAIAVNLMYPCFPLGPQDDDRLADRATAWLDAHAAVRVRYPRLYTWMPHVFLALDLDKENGRIAGQPTRTEARHSPDGTLLVWDSIYSVTNSSIEYVVTEELLQQSGWRRVAEFKLDRHVMAVYVSSKDANGRASNGLPGVPDKAL